MKKIFFFSMFLLFISCSEKHKQARQVEQLVTEARQEVTNGNWNAAKIHLQAVHDNYPRQIAYRKEAKQLMDSIVYLEALRNLQYSDSLLQPLLPEVDKLLVHFNCEISDKYESNGKYVHKQLSTTRNIGRCFLQSYIGENMSVVIKSYYYGKNSIEHYQVKLSVGDDYRLFSGHPYSFTTDDGTAEIVTLSEDDALDALRYIANNNDKRIKVTLYGKSEYGYYLNDVEKQAITLTCRLALTMHDVSQLEQQINIASQQIAKYEGKNML